MLPAYVAQRRWFGAKDEAVTGVRLLQLDPLPGTEDLLLAEIEVTTDAGGLSLRAAARHRLGG